MLIKKTQIKLIISLVTIIVVPLFAFYYFSYAFIEGTYRPTIEQEYE